MMSSATLRLVLLISCAHALVHIYELSLPSVEQRIAEEYRPDQPQAGKQFTGRLSTTWRLPFGLGALAAGWLVDRFGGRRMLALYLLGCAAMCALAGFWLKPGLLFVTMFSMGTFACIYHPAGLALISHETTAENRPRALGIHGIFGSAGIAAAPFLAATLLTAGFGWHQYYWALMVPGLLLGLVFLRQAHRDVDTAVTIHAKSVEKEQANWLSYVTLIILAMMQGFIYSAMMSFLPRYLSHWQPPWMESSGVNAKNYLAAGVLLIGCIGQYAAGRVARPRLLEAQITLITFGNAPFLLWMGLATGWQRVAAAASFALVHFMNQPIYNSLIAKYTPRHRRSLCYGLSFAMAFGLGSFGALFHGEVQSERVVYISLAGVALTAGCVGMVLCWQNRGQPT